MAKQRKSSKTGIGGSRELLTWALHGLEQEISDDTPAIAGTRVAGAQAACVGAWRVAAADCERGAGDAPRPRPKVRKKRKLSADARRRIAEAQKRRWAKVRAGKA